MRIPGFFLLLFSLLCCWSPQSVLGQQNPLYTQYLFNGLVFNPAYAGSQESMSISTLFRKQWTGLSGSPENQTLTAHTPLKNKRVSLGLMVMNDNIGVTNQTGVDGMYAYRISFSEKRRLSFGLQAGYAQVISRYNSLNLKDPDDPSFADAQASYNALYFGGGLYYASEKFFLGFSSPHFNRTTISQSVTGNESKHSRNYFISTGYVFKLSPAFKLKPGLLVRSTQELAAQADINCMLLYEDIFWLGLSYRTKSALCMFAKVQLSNQLSLGYAYDNTLGKLNAVTRGGHELILTYNFSFFKSNIISPRDF